MAVRRQSYLFILLALLASLRVSGRTPIEEYALILNGDPLVRQISSRKTLHTGAAVAKLAPIRSAQSALRQELAQRNIRVNGSVQTLLNAVFVRVPRDREAELRALPGVQNVVRMPRLKRHLNTAVDLVNVRNAWTQLGGTAEAGAGVKIGIIDSGIDDTHPAFQDNSLQAPSGYPIGDTSYTNSKIIVARSYQAMFNLPDDPTPLDRSGHGTALAMIAAGNTVQAPLATITGVAPKAWLGNYKIFGSPGVNDSTFGSIVVQALDDAFNDGMDIALVAFGYPATYGPLDTCKTTDNKSIPCDVSAQAVENAVQSGMTVVVSAGNDAQNTSAPPGLNTINSPGTAPSAITVGASTNSHIFYSTVKVTGSNVPGSLQSLDAVVGDGPRLMGTLSGPLTDVSTVDSSGLACSTLPGGSLTGNIVLIERSPANCDFSTKINNAQQAGAIGVILYQSDVNAPPFGALGAGNTGLPAVMIGNADGMAVANFLKSNPSAHVTLDPTLHEENTTPNVMTLFSSRGPSIDYAIKPELVAVGQGLYTATETLDPSGDLYDSSGYTSVQGSSFAAAMVAGAAGLVLQANPAFKDKPAQIKSALVTTAVVGTNDITDYANNLEAPTAVYGNGKLDAAAALTPGATVSPSTISFGWVGSNTPPSSLTIPLNITNTQSTTATYKLTFMPNLTDSNDVITADKGTVQVAAGQSAKVTLTLSGSFPTAGTYDGVINITGPNTNIYVPYWYLVSGISSFFDVMPVINSSFFGAPGDTCWLIGLKVVDGNGIAVPNASVQFNLPTGAALSTDPTCPSYTSTDQYGIATAYVDLGSSTGTQTFTGTAQGLNAVFYASVRPVPVFSSNAIVDAASFQVGQGLAPGSYVAIYGSSLTDATHFLTTPFLPFGMSGTSVAFWSADLTQSWPGRLWYISPGQVNVQIPWELQGQTSAKVYLTTDGITSDAYTIPIASYLPAMYLYNNLAIAQDTKYNLITAANPAKRGSAIVIYANGLGAVDNPPPSGEITPSQPYARTLVTPVVTIGGVQASVAFSGLTPGSIGLYQINVTVPANAPTGTQPVVVKMNNVSSQAANLPVQ
ncbi:MAG: S8 family serine peptidase [Bryobacteraceae bacterium]